MKKAFITISVFLAAAGFMTPQSSAKSVAESDTVSVNVLDASDYSMMKRWRPEAEVPFKKGKFSDNLFFGVAGSGFRSVYSGYSGGPRFSVHVGKWFNHHSALRISPGVGYYFDNQSGARIKQIDVKASYLLNITSYLKGYRPSRFFDVSAVAGAGYSYSWKSVNSIHSVSAHLGLNFDIHILKNTHLFFEPVVDMAIDGLGRPASEISRRIMPFFCGTVGLSYLIENDSRDFLPRGNWFVYLAGSTQLQISDNALKNLSVKDAFGGQGAIGVGHRYWDWFAVRLSLAYSNSNWDVELNGTPLRAKYAVGRLEAMLDLVSLIGKKDDYRFSFSLMFGPEAGVMMKDKIGRRVIPFVGMTGGVQLKSRLSDRFSIFVEPRMSYVPYPASTGKAFPANANYSDGLFNCNIGLEFDIL